MAFRGNGSLFAFQYDRESGNWVRGGYLTFDGSDNNIMLIDTEHAAGDSGFYNYFYSVTGLGTASFQPSFYRYQVPGTNQLSVREIGLAAPVPEPAVWAMLVAGFGVLGAAMRRGRSRMVRRCTL